MLLHLPLEITGKSNENLRSNGQRPLLYSQIFGSSGSMKWKRSNVGDCRSQNWLLQCFSFALVFLWALGTLSSHVRIGSEASKTNKKMSINPNLYWPRGNDLPSVTVNTIDFFPWWNNSPFSWWIWLWCQHELCFDHQTVLSWTLQELIHTQAFQELQHTRPSQLAHSKSEDIA